MFIIASWSHVTSRPTRTPEIWTISFQNNSEPRVHYLLKNHLPSRNINNFYQLGNNQNLLEVCMKRLILIPTNLGKSLSSPPRIILKTTLLGTPEIWKNYLEEKFLFITFILWSVKNWYSRIRIKPGQFTVCYVPKCFALTNMLRNPLGRKNNNFFYVWSVCWFVCIQ